MSDNAPPFPVSPAALHYEDLEVGQVVALGACAVEPRAMTDFIDRFVPGWPGEKGAPEALMFCLWSRLFTERAQGLAQIKMLATDALRFARHPPAGELLRGRMTVMGKDPVGDERGIIIAQHDLLDEDGRLVFSCLTRAIFARRT